MKQTLGVALFVFAFGGASIFTELWYRTDDLSLRYNIWKVGLWPRPDSLAWSLMADSHGVYLKGMTKDEIKALFPGAHEGPSHFGEPLYKYEEQYNQWDIRDKEHLWLDEGHLAAFFIDGRFEYLANMEG
jgi:hypothetical protein